MKTARFGQVVEQSGPPHTHLLFADPAKDKTLQQAERQHRVMTVSQSTVGQKKDHGEVGLKPGATRQFLIFPKSLASFEGKKIVGIDYDLLEDAPTGRTATRPKAATPKAASREHPLAEVDDHAATGKVIKFPRQTKKSEAPDVAALKAKVRRAIKELENGKQVAAFKLLKEIAS